MSLEIIRQNILSLAEETLALSPEIFKERLYCAYQSKLLDALKKSASIDELKMVLADNWSFVKGTTLCYTARPEDALTLLLCDVAEYLGKETNKAPIKILMPNVYTESMHDAYPNLDELDIRIVLKTHILSRTGLYLIPVRLLSELKGPWEDSEYKLNNYYYDYDDKISSSAYVEETELQRLAKHSVHTQALVESKEEFELLVKDTGFLGHLQALIRALRFNSTSGIGTEQLAGQGVYWAVSQFNDYYTKLGDIQNQIPKPIKEAIDRLITISSDHDENREATKTTETCANARQQELSALVKEQEAALMAISIDDENKSKLLAQAKERFESNLATLLEQLEKKIYRDGQDALGITHNLLVTFDVRPTITSPETLQDFLTLSGDEIRLIAEKEGAVRVGIFQQLSSIESLVLFCLTTPLEPLEALMAVIGKELAEKLIRTDKDVSACLILFQGQGARLDIVVNALKDKLPRIIQNRDDFMRVIKKLDPEPRIAVCEELKHKLSKFVVTFDDFKIVIRNLSYEQCKAFFEILKDKLLENIKYGYDFVGFFKTLNSDERTIVIEMLKDKPLAIIKNSHNFAWVLQNLSPLQCKVICEAIKDKLPKIFVENFHKDSFWFWNALEILDFEQCQAVCEALKDKLSEIFMSSEHFGWVLQKLNSDKCALICSALKEELLGIIQNSYGFAQMLKSLEPGKCAVVCNALKDKLPEIINRTYGKRFGFDLMLKYALCSEQQAVVREALIDREDILESKSKFSKTFESEIAENKVTTIEVNTPVFTPSRKHSRSETVDDTNEDIKPTSKRTKTSDFCRIM